MDCNVVKDLIPLYIDDCCSQESVQIVEEHISHCQECKQLIEVMKTSTVAVEKEPMPKNFGRINLWKASILQSVLLFLSFGLVTIGVALEASTPMGFFNAYWAFNLVVPATGMMLSLAAWYFVRLFKNRKSFSNVCSIVTLVIILCAWLWAMVHYEANFVELTNDIFVLFGFLISNWLGIVLTVIFCFLAKVLSNMYARMLGKE